MSNIIHSRRGSETEMVGLFGNTLYLDSLNRFGLSETDRESGGLSERYQTANN